MSEILPTPQYILNPDYITGSLLDLGHPEYQLHQDTRIPFQVVFHGFGNNIEGVVVAHPSHYVARGPESALEQPAGEAPTFDQAMSKWVIELIDHYKRYEIFDVDRIPDKQANFKILLTEIIRRTHTRILINYGV